MKNYKAINESISNRAPCTSFEENTYHNRDLFKEFCKTRDYKYVAIFGPYKNKYKWTDNQALDMYNKSPDGWTDGVGVYRQFDWGKGENQVVTNWHDQDWHIPELDHIVSRDEAIRLGWSQKQIDDPSNMQVLARKVNRMLSNIADDEAAALIPVLVSQFSNLKVDNI
jgi:hypothetical protein